MASVSEVNEVGGHEMDSAAKKSSVFASRLASAATPEVHFLSELRRRTAAVILMEDDLVTLLGLVIKYLTLWETRDPSRLPCLCQMRTVLVSALNPDRTAAALAERNEILRWNFLVDGLPFNSMTAQQASLDRNLFCSRMASIAASLDGTGVPVHVCGVDVSE